jgi:hypothetical protein
MHSNQRHHELLAELALEASTYLEVGVQDGHSLAAVVGANPAIDVVLCDTWGSEHGGTGKGSHAHIEERLNTLHHTGTRVYLDGYSRLLIPTLTQRFDLVHIDGDHSPEGCLADLRMCWPLTAVRMVVHDQILLVDVRNATFAFLPERSAEFAHIFLSAADGGTLVITRAQGDA